MKIAIISDIHSNLQALQATLKDIEKRNVDKIFCLGDIIAKGVHPEECVKLIKEKCDIVVHGNCDRNFSKDHSQDMEEQSIVEQKRIKWNQSLMCMEIRDYLSKLPFAYEFYMSGSLIRLFHASPESDEKVVTNYASIQEKLKLFYPTEKDSNVMETTRSNYLILEGEYGKKEYTDDISFQFIRVPYDINEELKDEYLNLEKENYRYELTEGKYRDMTKIEDGFRKMGIDVDSI